MQKTMSPRERWLAVLTGQKPDRIPMDYWATAEASAKLMARMGCESEDQLHERLHLDVPLSVVPEYVGPTVAQEADIYGCRYKDVSYGTGVYRECVYNPLAKYQTLEEIKTHYTWPTADWYDFTVIPNQIEGRRHRPIRGGGSEPFLIYKRLRSDEQALMDLILRPRMVHYCLDELFDFCYEYTRRIYEQIPGQVMLTYVAEDMGSENALMFSPQQIREFLLPRMERMIDLAHEAGAYAFHHNDGAIREILPDLIDIGIDILNPIQWKKPGMERRKLQKDFGDELIFHGAVDNQYTLAFGSEEEVREEVKENIEILGAKDNYILAPCHNIQAVSPVENIVAMYEAGLEYGRL